MMVPPTKNIVFKNHTNYLLIIIIKKRVIEIVDYILLQPYAIVHWRKVTTNELNVCVFNGSTKKNGLIVNFDYTGIVNLSIRDDADVNSEGLVFEQSDKPCLRLVGKSAIDFSSPAYSNVSRFYNCSDVDEIWPESSYALKKVDKIFDFALNERSRKVIFRLQSERLVSNRANKLVKIRHVNIVSSKYLFIINESGEILEDQSNLTYISRNLDSGLSVSGDGLYDFSRPDFGSGCKVKFDFPLFILGNGLISTYGHWLLDLAPRLAAYKKISSEQFVMLLVPDSIPVYIYETLDSLGIDRRLLLKFSDISPSGIPIFCENVYFSTCSGMMDPQGGVSKNCRFFYKDELQGLLDSNSAGPTSEKVFVARRNHNRNFVNAELVYGVFKKHGFSVVFNEDLSLKEKYKLYSNVKILAGAIGSNLSTSVFMPTGGVLIELVGDRYSLETRSLAYAYGHEFISIIGKSEEGVLPHLARIEFDINFLDKSIASVLEDLR